MAVDESSSAPVPRVSPFRQEWVLTVALILAVTIVLGWGLRFFTCDGYTNREAARAEMRAFLSATQDLLAPLAVSSADSSTSSSKGSTPSLDETDRVLRHLLDTFEARLPR